MKTNFFGEPRPKGQDEIREALDMQNMSTSDCRVLIDPPDGDGMGSYGFSAEVIGDNERSFSTLAYETKQELLDDLKAVGLNDVDDQSDQA